jgi:ABC-type dipeptide/oligopeptide/nickel transport system permease subunit
MTTPPAAGSDPEPPGARRGLESYPEFFAYPIDPNVHETAVMSRVPADGHPPYQKAYTPPPEMPPEGFSAWSGAAQTTESEVREGVRTPAAATSVYPDTYIKDKPPAEFQAFSKAPAQPPPVAEPLLPSPAQPGTGTAPRTPAKSRAPGRRRAKRSLVQSLWPFQAFTRPASATSTSAHIRSRSTTATVLRKLRADRAAVLAGWTIVVLILLAVFAPVVTGLFGVSPTTLHPELTDATFGPHGGFGGISWSHPLGVDQRLGRDVMARLLFGARVSLLIACGATLLSVGVGVSLGIVSGYLGGRVDLVIMRIADVFLAFPLILFALGLTGALSDQAFGLSGNALRIAIMIFVMGFFNWPYIARIVRAEVLSLRGREFVDAARAMGATTRWILGRELLPNLMAPILVYTTLLIPANIIFEAGLSALGIGLDPPASSWGQMMTDAIATVYTDPEYLIVPGMAVFITVLAFNLFGDGLRNATDPTAQ